MLGARRAAATPPRLDYSGGLKVQYFPALSVHSSPAKPLTVIDLDSASEHVSCGADLWLIVRPGSMGAL